jgi:hypothetical protein
MAGPNFRESKKMRNFTVAIGFAVAIAAMFALAQAKAEDMLKSGGKCWMDDNKANFGWADCPREQSTRAAKASKASAKPPSRLRPATSTRAPSEGGGGRY